MNKITKQNSQYDFIKTGDYLPKNCFLVGVNDKNGHSIYALAIQKAP